MTGWPWPLDGVQKFFEDLWNWISTAATDAVKVVSTWIWDGIKWLRDRVSDVGAWLWDVIKGAISGIAGWLKDLWNSITGALTAVRDYIWNGISGIVKSVTDIIGKVSSSISSWLSSLWNSISSALVSVRDSLWNGLSGLSRSMSSALGGAVSEISRGINALGGAVWQWMVDAMANVAKALGEGLKAFWDWLRGGISALMSGLVSGISWLGSQVRSAFEGLANMVLAPVTKALKPGSPPEPLGQVTQDLGRAIFDNIEAQIMKVAKSPVSPATAVAAGVGVLGGIGIMNAVGNVLTMAFDATHPVKAWGLQEMFNRIVLNLMSSPVTAGILSVPVAIGIIKPMTQFYNQQFQPEIPGPGDLIRFVVREVIDPGVFAANMALQGFSSFWADAFWEAHWVLPSAGDVREAMWRGIITSPEYNTYLVLHDFKPQTRPGISKSDQAIMSQLSYKLPGRIDARFMARWGAIGKDELKKLTVMDGMDPAWVDKVTDAEWANMMLDERTAVRTALKAAVKAGAITPDAYKKGLEEVRFTKDEIALSVRALEIELDTQKKGEKPPEEKDTTRDERTALATAYQNRFKEGYIPQATLEGKLKELGFDENEVKLRMERAQLEYDNDWKSDLMTAYKAAYAKGEIDEAELFNLVKSVVPDVERAKTLSQIEQLKKLAKPKVGA